MDSRGYQMALDEANARFNAVTDRLTSERDEAQRQHANLHGRYLRLQAERDRLLALLREVEFCIRPTSCPVCDMCLTHAPDCRLQAALEGRDG